MGEYELHPEKEARGRDTLLYNHTGPKLHK